MAKEMALRLGISVALGSALTGLKKFSDSMGKVSKATEKLEEKLKKLKAYDEAKNKMIELNKEYVESVGKLQKLKSEYEKSGTKNVEFAKRIKEAERYVEKLNKQKERQKQVFKAARSQIENENISLIKYKDELKKVNIELEKTKKLNEFKKFREIRNNRIEKIEQASSRNLQKGVATAGIVLAPIKAYIDVEESQADLRKMLGDEAKKYYNKLKEISDNSPLSQPQVYEIAGALAQAGIGGNDIVEYTKKANQIAVAFDMGTQEAGEFLAKTKSQLNLGKEELFRYADTINYLADNTASQASQIVEVSQRVASLGGIAGVSKEGVAAFGATLISIGKTPEVAATGLKQLYGRLVTGNAATKSQKKHLSN